MTDNIFYVVWLETLELNCVDNASALTNSVYGIYLNEKSALKKAQELTDCYSEKIMFHIGSVCGGYYDGALVWVYQAKISDIDGKLVPIKTLYKNDINKTNG